MRPAAITGNEFIFVLVQEGSSEFFRMSQVSNSTVLWRASDSGGGTSVSTSNTFSSGVWSHVAGVVGSSTSRYIYLDGVQSSESTTSRTPTGLDRTVVGARGNLSNSYDGNIAWATIWNTALTDDEVLRLSTGVVPLTVRKENIVACWPLWGIHDPEIDLVGSFDLTLNGTTRGDDPPFPKVSRSLIGRDDLIKYVNGGMAR